jgi:hypothetical protein
MARYILIYDIIGGSISLVAIFILYILLGKFR